MPGIEVHCGNCGGTFTASEDMAGLIATCPKCERQVSVPLPDSIKQSRPKLQMKKEGTVDGGKRCPHCNGSMAPDAVICLQCGYDLRTGRPFSQPGAGLGQMKPLLTVLGLVILAGIVWTVMKQRSGSGIMGDPVPQAPAAAPQEQPQPAPAPAPAPAPVVEVVQPPAPEPAPAPAEAAPEKPVPVETPEQMRARLTRSLNDRYPMFVPGAPIAIRRVNGLVHRGELVVLGPQSATLKVEKQIVEVPYNVLDRGSRLRCDAEFRKKLVEYKVMQDGGSADGF